MERLPIDEGPYKDRPTTHTNFKAQNKKKFEKHLSKVSAHPNSLTTNTKP